MSAMLSGRAIGALCLMAAILATACFTPLSARPSLYRTGAGQISMVTTQAAGSGARTQVLQPQSPGTESFEGNGATLDISNMGEGYVTARYSGSAGRAKVQITRSGAGTYTYNLNTNGAYEVLPLTAGDGKYRICVYTQVSGDSYAEALVKTVDVKLRSPLLPFLYPNQHVNFSSGSQVVKLSGQLANGAADELAIVTNVYNYVTQNIRYDNDKAGQAMRGEMAGYLPAVDSILASGQGICYDYAAVMAAMLRAQQIPTRLEMGYVSGGTYHAWVSVYVKDVGWVNGVIYFDGKSWKLMDPTFAAGGSPDIMNFIGNGENYQRQFVY